MGDMEPHAHWGGFGGIGGGREGLPRDYYGGAPAAGPNELHLFRAAVADGAVLLQVDPLMGSTTGGRAGAGVPLSLVRNWVLVGPAAAYATPPCSLTHVVMSSAQAHPALATAGRVAAATSPPLFLLAPCAQPTCACGSAGIVPLLTLPACGCAYVGRTAPLLPTWLSASWQSTPPQLPPPPPPPLPMPRPLARTPPPPAFPAPPLFPYAGAPHSAMMGARPLTPPRGPTGTPDPSTPSPGWPYALPHTEGPW